MLAGGEQEILEVSIIEKKERRINNKKSFVLRNY